VSPPEEPVPVLYHPPFRAEREQAKHEHVLDVADARGDRLPAYGEGRAWHDVSGDDVNAYPKEIAGLEITAKDFRTW
jgi:DNA topoisomerase IB